MKALLLVDVQNDFVTGPLGTEYARFIAPKIVKFAKECLAKGYCIYATMDTHRAATYDSTLEGQRLPTRHCIEGTEGHRMVDGLPKDGDGNNVVQQGRIVQKRSFGSIDLCGRFGRDFGNAETNLGATGEQLEEIVICGFCTSICVISNALILRAFYPNVKITIAADLCGDVNDDSHMAALDVARCCQIDVANLLSAVPVVEEDEPQQ